MFLSTAFTDVAYCVKHHSHVTVEKFCTTTNNFTSWMRRYCVLQLQYSTTAGRNQTPAPLNTVKSL